MSKNIIIQNKGIEENLENVFLLFAGDVFWVPEDGTISGELTVHKNGTYTAKNDDIVYYSKVVVKGCSEVKGKKNGKTYIVTRDEDTGYLVYTEV